MGLFDGLGTFIASAGLNSVLSIANHESQAGLQNMSIQAQKNLMRENNKFQSEENQKSRDYTTEMYKRQLEDTQKWNDYSEIVRRAVNAGVSPSAIFGSGAPSQLGGITPPSVGHSASPSPSYADVINPPNRSAEAFHSIASALQSLSVAAKTGVETGKVGSLMTAQMKNYLSQASLNDVRQASENFELGLRKIFGSKLYDSELGRNYAQMVNSYHQAMLFAEQGKTEDSKRQLNLAERLYKDSLRDVNDSTKRKLDLEISWYPTYMRSYVDNINSSTEENRASAESLHATAEQTKFFNRLYNDDRVRHSLVTQSLEAGRQAVEQSKISKSQAEQMDYLVKQAAYATNMQEFTYWSDQINKFANTLGSVASQFYGAGALRELIKLRQMQQQPAMPVRGFTP